MGINLHFVEAKLSHINLRRSGNTEDAPPVSVDLKIEGIISGGHIILSLLTGCEESMAMLFWGEEQEGGVRDPVLFLIENIPSQAIFADGHEASISGLKLRPKKISKLKFKPTGGIGHMLNLSMVLSIEDINKKQLTTLAELLNEDVVMQVTADPDLFDGIQNEDDATSNDVEIDEVSQARELFESDGLVSMSALQRKMRIGYNRAARIIEAMEIMGLVSPCDQTGKRRLLQEVSQ